MKIKSILYFILFLFVVSFVVAVNCWDYTTESGCTGANCNWHDDPYGSDWCEQLDCWTFMTQEECGNAGTYNLSCLWKSGGGMTGWCSEITCSNYEGTNQTACENNSISFGLSCQWSGTEEQYNCMGGYQCNSKITRASCINVSGCRWGTCFEQGCWGLTQSPCNTRSDCAWNTNGWCESDSCYSSKYNTVEACTNTSDTKVCKWNPNYGGYCEGLTCHSFDYNQTGCLSPGSGLNCNWESSTSMCMEQGCWSYWSEDSCKGKIANGKNCTWQVSQMQNTGWCEKVACWSFDNISVTMAGGKSTNASYCVNNTYNLSCAYESNGGWCYHDVNSLSCLNLTDQRKCWDTMYCFWDDNAKICNDPSGGFQGGAIGGGGGGGSFKAPPCAVFYLNETNCNATIGCYYNYTLNGTAKCVTENSNILVTGLNCSLINDSTLCANTPFLPRCCEWQAGSCSENKFSTTCWDNLQTPPDGASYCEDTNAYNTESKCNQIANYPWYMPCVWNNATGKKRCEFANEFFGVNLLNDEKGDLDLLGNNMACEKGGGGTWVTESYCGAGNLSNISITVGRCVSKLGVAGGNCDISCKNCEYTSSGTNHSSETAARKACEESDIGFCGWISDSHASNGLGYCKPKKEFESGAVSKCTSTNCDACNMYQSAKRKEKCLAAACEWAVDPEYPTDTSKGSCIAKGEKTCVDDCAACKTNTSCIVNGRGGNATGSFACTWDATYNICKKSGGNSSTNTEICFDAIDNDNDGKIDCMDSGCYTDPFCGGGSMVGCFQYTNNDTCLGATGCYWFTDSFGSWCDMKEAMCFKYDNNQNECNQHSDACEWHQPPVGSSTSCMMSNTVMNQCYSLNSVNCANNANCTWFSDSFICDHKYKQCFMNYTLSESQTACNNANNTINISCSWTVDTYSPKGGYCSPPCKALGDNCGNDNLCEGMGGGGGSSGFCDPIGFGGGGGEVFECWKYDNNQTRCDNETECSWMIEPMPFCDMMMGYDCMQFGSNATTCNENGNCTWINESEMKNDPYLIGGWCGQKFEQCFMNTSLQNNADACNANPNCNYSTSWNTCEPTMFVQGATDKTSCESTGGLWRTGWCNPAGMAGMFKGMAMDSAPLFLGSDPCPEGIPAYSDICGTGIKDSPDNWGLGIGVQDIREATICNGVQTFQGQGSGTATTKFYWYLDTDGRETGGCSLDSDSSSVGWDLYFKYLASYANGSLSETRTAYRCINRNWTVSNIQLNSWKEKMCNHLRGGMVALNKDDLLEIEGLLNLSANIRFYVATANETYNSTVPLDQLGPVYYTPGTIDFMPECCWALSDANIDCDMDGLAPANDPDCEFMLKGKGVIKFEDCWGNGIDDDADGYTDCNDPDCKGNTYCDENNLGVEASGYTDTVSPKIIFWQIEKYPDSALLSFDTDEPTNGTVFFYRNVSGCTGDANATLYDIGIWNPDTPTYKNWHEVEIYNDGGTNSLDYSLTNNTFYFYKFKVCDQGSNCAQSACANFTTAMSAATCNKCFFVFNMDLPSGVTLDLDLNNNGTYESELHRQCGSSAGFLLNYTQARSVNLKLTINGTTPSTEIYLIGTRLTRTIVHKPELRKIDKADGIKANTTSTTAGTTVGYAGMEREIANKLVDKLHPNYCMIKISGTGTCTSLYHCADNLTNCVNKYGTTGYSVNETGSNYCIWKIPCVFSVYAGGQPGTAPTPTTTPTTTPGGGGGTSGGLVTAVSVAAKVSRYWSSVSAEESIKMEITKPEIAFTELTVRFRNAVSSVTVGVASLKEKPADLADASDKVYQYLELTKKNVEDGDIHNAKVEFKVPVSWLTENGVSRESVVLLRYKDDKWNEASTELVTSDDSYAYYEATTPGFSYFAIGSKVVVEEVKPKEEVVEEEKLPTGEVVAPLVEEEIPVQLPKPISTTVWIVIAIIVIVVIGVIVYVKKRKL